MLEMPIYEPYFPCCSPEVPIYDRQLNPAIYIDYLLDTDIFKTTQDT